ncbi:MAG: DegV family protein [Chloroflexota bacterium]
MAQVKIVTDSTADLPFSITKELDITVVPLNVHFGNETYRERQDIDEDQFFTRLAEGGAPPHTSPPSPEDFQKAYARLAQLTDSILSIHLSSKLSGTYAAARGAGDALRDRCEIVVIDSTLTSLGLGFIVTEAARAAREGQPLEAVARLARGMVLQTHVLFFVDSLEYLLRGGRIGKAQAILGTMLNVKPLFRLDRGEITLYEKVRTRAKAMERLYEFVADFPHIEKIAILHSTTPNEAHSLARRVDAVYPMGRIFIGKYGPVLGTHLGPGAMGVVVYEGQEELDIRT